jgi:hypothetical protein
MKEDDEGGREREKVNPTRPPGKKGSAQFDDGQAPPLNPP